MNCEIRTISHDSPEYPANLDIFLGDRAPATVSMIGSAEILAQPKLALFCSSRCPGKALVAAHDVAQQLRAEARTVISGFHAPMEKECLDILLRSPNPVIICPARGLGSLRIPAEWRRALGEGRLLILSPSSPEMRRGTARDGHFRNLFVAALADEVLVAHAAPGGKIAKLAKEMVLWGKPIRQLTA